MTRDSNSNADFLVGQTRATVALGDTGLFDERATQQAEIGDPAHSGAVDTLLRDGALPADAGASLTVLRRNGAEPTAGSRMGYIEDPHDWTGVWGIEVRVGDVLNQRYRLEKKLGQGGMGVVFLAVDVEDKLRPFAVKVLKSDFRSVPAMVKLLEDEVDKGRRLTHQNIVATYLLMRHQTVLYILMQFLEGKTLEQLLTDDYARGMPFNRAEALIKGFGAALAYAHDNGVIHSDVKPANAFVTTGGTAKMLDFGIGRAVRRDPTKRPDLDEVSGLTVSYASCEMFENQRPDVRDDIYSFACMVYELLAGRHPFDGRAANVARDDKSTKLRPIPGISASQNRAIARALAFEREQRTPSIEEFLECLTPTRRRPWMLLGLLGMSLMLLTTWAFKDRVIGLNTDQLIVQSLMKPGQPRAEDYDPARVQEDLEMGAEDVARASRRFDSSLLTEGTSNALDAYLQVLEADPGNATAANGVLSIFKLYRRQAKSLLDQGQTRLAYDVAITGLSSQSERKLPADPELRSIVDRLQGKLNLAVPDAPH